ncbi:hypothetical protein ACJJIF_04385 [Microbulbifer sp. SSSA002]|uniref:hypothetical protein n=1 Tax=unclassified Microbulbifer TaxID=2619833 RepID=UPI00403935C9
MPSYIIPVRTLDGFATSISIDEDIYLILLKDFGSEADCRAWIRKQAQRFERGTILTRRVRQLCLQRVVKPSLLGNIELEA